jgi:hypothetical protein
MTAMDRIPAPQLEAVRRSWIDTNEKILLFVAFPMEVHFGH